MSAHVSPDPGLRVVVVEHADADAIAGLRALVSEYVQTWYAPDQPLSDPDTALLATLPALLAATDSQALLAVLAGAPVGCLLVRPAPGDPGALEIRKMFVRPAARRSGAARALLGAASAFATSAHDRRLVLCVHADRRAARELYRSFGFAETGIDADGFVSMSACLPPLRPAEALTP